MCLSAACAPAGTTARDRLLVPRHLETPSFAPPPAESPQQSVSRLAADLRGPGGSATLQQLVPPQVPCELIGGMTFISHIGPVALSLAAFAALARPWLAGALLVTAAATLFYPVFFFPAWLGYYWRSRPAALRFVGGCVVATALIGVPALLMSRAVEGRSVIGTLFYETQGHQEIKEGYGSSPFGFWGQRGGVRAASREPLVEGQPNTSPMVLAFLAFVAAAFFMARGRGEVQLALLTGALAVAVQVWKIHGTGVYVNWYYPFLLLGFFGSIGAMTRSAAPQGRTAPGPGNREPALTR